MKYTRKSPCSNCPFRSDRPFHLRPGRVREIEHSLDRGEFPCHKTVDYDQDEDTTTTTGNEQEVHCAGALILLEKLERPSQMMRICERIGLYDRRKLDMNAPVYDDFEQMERGCSERQKSRTK